LIIAAGIAEIYYIDDYPNMQMTYDTLKRAGVKINKLEIS